MRIGNKYALRWKRLGEFAAEGAYFTLHFERVIIPLGICHRFNGVGANYRYNSTGEALFWENIPWVGLNAPVNAEDAAVLRTINSGFSINTVDVADMSDFELSPRTYHITPYAGLGTGFANSQMILFYLEKLSI